MDPNDNSNATAAPTIANASPDQSTAPTGPQQDTSLGDSRDLNPIDYKHGYDSRSKIDQKQYKNARPEGAGQSIIDLPYEDTTTAMAEKRLQYIHLYHIPTKTELKFKAFLSDFKDNFKTDYQKEQVFGRSDPIVSFKATERSITLGFTVPSNDLSEAKFNLYQVNQLVKRLYPTYDKASDSTGGATTIKGGPIWKLKFANLITAGADGSMDVQTYGLPGVLNGFSYDPIMEEGFMDEISKYGWTGNMYPQSIRVSFDYTVLHDTPLGFDDEGTWRGNRFHNDKEGYFPYYPGPNPPTNHLDATPLRGGPLPNAADLLEERTIAQKKIDEQRAAYANYKPHKVTPPSGVAPERATMSQRYREFLASPDASNLDPTVLARMQRFADQSDAKHEGIQARLDAQPEARDQKTHSAVEQRRRAAVKAGLLSPMGYLGGHASTVFDATFDAIGSALTFWDDDD